MLCSKVGVFGLRVMKVKYLGLRRKIDQWTINGVWNDLTSCLFLFVVCEIQESCLKAHEDLVHNCVCVCKVKLNLHCSTSNSPTEEGSCTEVMMMSFI